MDQNQLARRICAAICRGTGLRAREIAAALDLDRQTVNQILYGSPLMKELCWQDRDYRWHGIMCQSPDHTGLQEFAAYFSQVGDFLALSESDWLARMREGCANIGRSLSDTRGLTHSFLDCRAQMFSLFSDLREMLGESCLSWQIAFELRLKRSRHVRIYADVLVITADRVFSLEFKMKKEPEAAEIQQAAKYVPYLEILFGPRYEIIPVLVLTGARELFSFVPIGGEDRVLPLCSGDMLFNVFDEYLGFLS